MNIKKFACIILINNVMTKKLLSNFSKSQYQPKTMAQYEYNNALYNKMIDLLICTGPAGTGKTLLACQYAIESLQKNSTNKIIITRPTIAIEENIGFLPGNIKDKMHPWTIPIFDIFKEFYTQKDIDKLINENVIEIVPVGFMQGRTFKNSIIIADEMQNSTPNQMFMLLTRIGVKSKMMITGDLMQTTNKDNGLYDLINKLNLNYISKDDMEDDGIKMINFQTSDIQRSKIVSKITSIYNK
jgi:phosphate starvation-inducible PhoH-like protein